MIDNAMQLLGSHYTDEQITFIGELRNKGKTWNEVAQHFNKKYKQLGIKTCDALRNAYKKYSNIDFSDDSFIQNAKTTFLTKKRNSRLVKENKKILEHIITLDDIRETFDIILDKIEFKLHSPVKFPKSSKPIERTLVAHLSDTHYGNNVSSGELGGLNSYNNVIAARRTALFFQNIANFKPQYRDITDLVLILNGDLGAGIIHNQEHAVDLMTRQFATILSIIGQGVTYLAQHFKKITVYCTPDNHMRFQHKQSKDRSTVHKWDSFATMAHVALKREFNNYKNINFIIPESPYAIFDIQGHKAFATHGDNVFEVGNASKVIKVGDIASQVDKINNSDLSQNKKFELFFIAHVHAPMILLLDNGSYVYINGCLSGLDAFGNSIGIFGNHPTQQLIEITKEHIGDCRLVRVKEADNNKSLDKIITMEEDLFTERT